MSIPFSSSSQSSSLAWLKIAQEQERDEEEGLVGEAVSEVYR